MDVVFYEIFSEEEVQLKKWLPKNIRADFRKGTIQSYPSSPPPASIISIRTQSVIPDEWNSKLKGILTRSSGYNHLRSSMGYCENGLQIGYLPDYCARSVAEHAILVTLALLKKLKKQTNHFNTFNRDDITGQNCQNRNVLVVGVGKIGKQIVKLAKALEMNVKGVDLVQNSPSLEYVSLKEGLRSSEIVICALPLTNKTKEMLNYETLRELPKGAIFVNISRGEISPLTDLAKLLDENILSGISIDVFEHESTLAAFLQGNAKSGDTYLKLIMSLKDKENVIFTPHNAFNSIDDLNKKAELSCLALKMFSETGQFPEKVRGEYE